MPRQFLGTCNNYTIHEFVADEYTYIGQFFYFSNYCAIEFGLLNTLYN